MLRLFAISGFAVPFEAMVFAFVCWYLLSKYHLPGVHGVCSVTRADVVEVPLLYNTFRLLGRAFDGVSTRSSLRETDSFYRNHTEDRQLVGSFPQGPTFTSPGALFNRTLSEPSNRSSFSVSFRAILEGDSAVFPTSISSLGYHEETTDLFVDPSINTLSYLSSSEYSPSSGTSRPLGADSPVPRPRPPRSPPRSRASPPISPHYLMRQTFLTAQESRGVSPLITPEPTFRDPFKFY